MAATCCSSLYRSLHSLALKSLSFSYFMLLHPAILGHFETFNLGFSNTLVWSCEVPMSCYCSSFFCCRFRTFIRCCPSLLLLIIPVCHFPLLAVQHSLRSLAPLALCVWVRLSTHACCARIYIFGSIIVVISICSVIQKPKRYCKFKNKAEVALFCHSAIVISIIMRGEEWWLHLTCNGFHLQWLVLLSFQKQKTAKMFLISEL